MELNGVWKALPATDELRRNATGLDVDDQRWDEIPVPGHWQRTKAFRDVDGPMLYRHRFDVPPPEDSKRRWLTLEGVFYQADVWLDGAYIGDPEGYFIPHSYDITDLSRLDSAHVLAVEVTCSPQSDPRTQRNITGSLQSGVDPDWNPGGIWRPVRIHDTGPARIDRLRVLCRDADEHRAHVLLTAQIDIDSARRVTLRTLVDGATITESIRQLATGVNDVSWSLDIGDPQLWWPYALGEQSMIEVAVEIEIDGTISDRSVRRVGLREVAWDNWICNINGERIHLKGANLLPTRFALGEATDAECLLDVELARDAGLNMLRLHGHIGLGATYDAADELGMLVMQDFPLRWGYQRTIRNAALRQARAMVDLLGHHPSVVHWNAHTDPGAVSLGMSEETGVAQIRHAAVHQVPTWNRSILDRWLKREIEQADPTRAVSRASGVLPRLPSLGGSDAHLYFGWYHGQLTDEGTLARQAPNLFRFVSEFGAQSVPERAGFIAEQIATRAWPDWNWDDLAQHHGFQRAMFEHHVPPTSYDSPAEWSLATQLYQAQVLRYQIELLRRLKYRPSGGFALFCLNDPAESVSFAVLDHDRVPKTAYHAVQMACQTVLAVADPMPTRAVPGEVVQIDLWIVNDDRYRIPDARLDASVGTGDELVDRSFSGDLDPDSVVRVGTFQFVMPSSPQTLKLELSHNGATLSTNEYRISPV